MKKEITNIHFDMVLPFSSPIVPHIEELSDITTKKEFIENYNKAKKLRSKLKIKSKIYIIVEEKCPCCGEITSNCYSLKRLKELFEHNLIELPKRRKNSGTLRRRQ